MAELKTKQNNASVAAFLHLWGRDLHYDNPKLDDIKPWLYETRRHFRGDD